METPSATEIQEMVSGDERRYRRRKFIRGEGREYSPTGEIQPDEDTPRPIFEETSTIAVDLSGATVVPMPWCVVGTTKGRAPEPRRRTIICVVEAPEGKADLMGKFFLPVGAESINYEVERGALPVEPKNE